MLVFKVSHLSRTTQNVLSPPFPLFPTPSIGASLSNHIRKVKMALSHPDIKIWVLSCYGAKPPGYQDMGTVMLYRTNNPSLNCLKAKKLILACRSMTIKLENTIIHE